MNITAFVTCLLSLTTAAVSAAPQIIIELDRKNALYKCGEKASFKITVQDDTSKTLVKNGSLTAILTNDGRKKLAQQTYELDKQNPVIIQDTLPQPGFLRLQTAFALPEGKQKKIFKIYGAGFSPRKITSAVPVPGDFMQFWKNAVKEAENIPLDLQIEPLAKYTNEKHSCCKLSVAAPGGRVYGFLCIPTAKKRHPLLVTVPGAGPGYGTPAIRNDVASLVMNVHPYDPMIPGKTVRDSYKELNKPGIYMYHGAPDRKKLFYYRAILGCSRLLDYVLSLPEINPGQVGYHGSSQGGAFGFILGGLTGKFQAIACNVPAMCDHLGYKLNRNPGWPFYCGNQKYSKEIEAMVPYYDAANFAGYIKAPIRVIVGFADTTCSPSSVYAAFNGIPSSNKDIINEIGMGHACRPSYSQSINWVLDTIRK